MLVSSRCWLAEAAFARELSQKPSRPKAEEGEGQKEGQKDGADDLESAVRMSHELFHGSWARSPRNEVHTKA